MNAACALVERERVLLAETEEHLQQYGYTPVLTPGVEREGGGGGANGGEMGKFKMSFVFVPMVIRYRVKYIEIYLNTNTQIL